MLKNIYKNKLRYIVYVFIILIMYYLISNNLDVNKKIGELDRKLGITSKDKIELEKKQFDFIRKENDYDKVIKKSTSSNIFIYEYYDMNCVECRKLHNTIFSSSTIFNYNFNYVLRSNPLEETFKDSLKKHILDSCIYDVYDLGEYKEYIIEISSWKLDKMSYGEFYEKVMTSFVLDRNKLETCTSKEETILKIEKARSDTYLLNLYSTPSIIVLIGEKVFKFEGVGAAQAFSVIKDVIFKLSK